MRFRNPFRRSQKSAPAAFGGGWQNVLSYRGRHGSFHDHSPGSWQRDIRIDNDQMQRHHAVFACMSQIAGDIAKLRLYLKQLSGTGGFWSETVNPAYSAVLSAPNFYQTPGQFLESWIWSRLGHGNFYALKMRDNRNVVNGLWPLDPFRVRPMVANDGSAAVFYEVMPDRQTPGLTETIMVPAREIIHDRVNTTWHPLIGTSPLYAATSAAAGGLAMARSSARFFEKGAQLSGVLVGPGQIDPDTVKRLEERWEEDFGGGAENAGKIAVLGSGLKFEPMQMTAVDAQLVESMKWSAAMICSVFAMPQWKIQLDVWPRGIVNVQALAVDYLSGCLQRHMHSIEDALTVGLGLAAGLRVALDETALLRMDAVTQMAVLKDGVSGGIYAPNEARARLGLPPVPGGDNVFMQQQNFSLEALAAPGRSTTPGSPAMPPELEPAKALPPPTIARVMNREESAAFLAIRPQVADDDE